MEELRHQKDGLQSQVQGIQQERVEEDKQEG